MAFSKIGENKSHKNTEMHAAFCIESLPFNIDLSHYDNLGCPEVALIASNVREPLFRLISFVPGWRYKGVKSRCHEGSIGERGQGGRRKRVEREQAALREKLYGGRESGWIV